MLDIRNLATFADYFVICSAESVRQIDTICKELDKVLGGQGVSLHHREGIADSGWVLMDFGDVVVHIFSPSERERYRLDELWARAVQVVRIV